MGRWLLQGGDIERDLKNKSLQAGGVKGIPGQGNSLCEGPAVEEFLAGREGGMCPLTYCVIQEVTSHL